tara:strand:- start:281 stop:685 length:405 start_codon:yes stop_codon:yes gene_type:complete
MARRTSIIKLNQISDINMTPLMDLTFILLITFIITFPLIEQGLTINLPRGEASNLSNDNSKSISLNIKNEIFYDGEQIGKVELIATLQKEVKNNPDMTFFVRADQALPYKNVMDLMRILNDANISKMALVTQVE